MILEDILASLLAATGSGGALVVLFRAYLEYRTKNRIEAHTQALRDQVHVYDALNYITTNTGAKSAAVIRSANGGGIPSPNKPVKVSKLHWVFAAENMVPLVGTNEQAAGEEICLALKELAEDGDAEIHLDTLGAGSPVRATMEYNGVGIFYLRKLSMSPHAMICLMVSFAEDAHLTPRQAVHLNLGADKLRAIMANYLEK